ncbi:MAG TPA: type II and III secretion system protein [Armatimonadota bacterium]
MNHKTFWAGLSLCLLCAVTAAKPAAPQPKVKPAAARRVVVQSAPKPVAAKAKPAPPIAPAALLAAPASVVPPPVAALVPAPPAVKPAGPALVNNVFTDTDIRTVFSEVASQVGVTIIADDSVKSQNINVEFRNDTVEGAVEKTALFGGLVWKKRSDGVYLVSSGTPDAPLFREFAVTRRYMPRNQPAASLLSLLSSSAKPYVAADQAGNSMSVCAPEPLANAILADIRELDAPSRQFVVEALITELGADKGREFGFSWNWNQFGMDSSLTLNYAKATSSDIAKLKALISNGTATLRANPRISAFEGQEALLNVGTETYFSILSGNTNFPTAQIQLIKTGVTLKLTGFIGDDGYITLDLDPEVGDFAASVGGNPTVTVRKASTHIRVKSGETIVIGGLIQDQTTSSTSKVPILGYVPILGQFFTQSSTKHKRTDVVMMITPRLTEAGAGIGPLSSGAR